ncbi:hypothetical protein AB6A40_000693 [Gnathostoma spinigerum]|uniref:Mediator of RNA polymerase II transcription subunit 9 n=1 Tax=Gnathostoma spinigerum TaxID=75299 RepID=A0ABD6E9E5_9BILA
MSSDGIQCLKNCSAVYSNVHSFISCIEKGNTSDVTLRLKQVELSIEQLRDSVLAVTDISRSETYQKQKIASLLKQIALKDDLINSLKDGECSFSEH